MHKTLWVFFFYKKNAIIQFIEVLYMYVYIGKLNGAHGLKGELKFKSDFLYLDRVLKKDLYLSK